MKMKRILFVIVGVAALSMFSYVPVTHGAVIWANDIIASSNVGNQNYALGSPDSLYASINAPFGYLTVGFGTNFMDLAGADVVMVDAVADWISLMNIKIGDIYLMEARRVADSGWSGLSWNTSLGGWQLLEIPGMYSGAYDQIRLTSLLGSGNWALEVDAIGVKHAIAPEPSTLMLLGIGLVGVAGFGMRKFKTQAT